MSGVWQTSDKPIQATDRESTINLPPKHFAPESSATPSTSIATSGAGIGPIIGIPESETHPNNNYHDHEECPSSIVSDQSDDLPGQQREDNPIASDVYESSPFFEYRKLVGSISQKLRKENALQLAYVYDLPNWYYEVGPTHDPTSALRILMALEGKGIFAPNNLAGLTGALEAIERKDLAQLVRDFRSKVAMETVRADKSSTLPRETFRSNNWRGSSCRARPPRYHHSISTTSLMPQPVQDTNVYAGDYCVYRSQSKPELEKYQVIDGAEAPAVAIAGSSEIRHPSVESLTLGGQEGAVGIGLQFTLMNLKTLEDQISRLRNHFTNTWHQSSIAHSSNYSTRGQILSLLDNARAHIADSMADLEQVCDLIGAGRIVSAGEPPSPARSTPVREVEVGLHPRTSSRRFSRNSSGGVGLPISRQSSGASTKGAAKFVNPLSSSGGMHNVTRKQLMFDQSVEKDSGTSSRRRRCSGYTELTQEDHDLQESEITAPFPGHMHPTPPSNRVKIKRRWSRRDEKKLSRKGVLVWQIKVKNLKEWYSQKTVSLSSEDFYDVSKRKFKATLHPFGLGPDEGSHMTLCIDCLDEMKSSQKIQNTDIVVSVIDPQSSQMPVPPICRQLERRGIRVIQQFISHAQVDNFLSDVIVVTIALTVKRLDQEVVSEDSDVSRSNESIV